MRFKSTSSSITIYGITGNSLLMVKTKTSNFPSLSDTDAKSLIELLTMENMAVQDTFERLAMISESGEGTDVELTEITSIVGDALVGLDVAMLSLKKYSGQHFSATDEEQLQAAKILLSDSKEQYYQR